jgi:hypothetical protein
MGFPGLGAKLGETRELSGASPRKESTVELRLRNIARQSHKCLNKTTTETLAKAVGVEPAKTFCQCSADVEKETPHVRKQQMN